VKGEETMPGGIKKSTKRLTICAVITTLGVIVLSLGSILEVLDLSAAALAGILVTIVVIEVGGIWPWLVWAATGLLSLLLPLKTAAIFYLIFAGYYPILKEKIEMLGSRLLQWVIKLLMMNTALTLVILVTKYILVLPDETLDWTWLIYPLANTAFVLFDIALTRLITVYLFKWRKKLGIKGLK